MDAITFLIELKDKVSGPAKSIVGALGKVKDIASDVGGGALKKLQAGFEAVKPVALAAAAALAAFGAALAVGAHFAIDAAEFKADMMDAFELYTGSQEAAAATFATVDEIAKHGQLGREKTFAIANDLLLAGIKDGEQLESSIKAVADLQAVAGDAGAGKLKSILEKSVQSGKFTLDAKQLVGTGVQVSELYAELAKRTGKGVAQVEAELKSGTIAADVGISALNATIDKKLGGIAAKQALDFGAQVTQLKDNLSRLFEDVDVGPLGEALHEVLAVFDQSTESGKALKWIVVNVFDALGKIAKAVFPYIRYFMLELVIVALKLYIAFKPFIKQFREWMASANEGDALRDLLTFFADIVVGGIVMVAALAAGIVAIGKAALDAYQWVKQLFSGSDGIGSEFVSGIIRGFSAGAGLLYDAVRNLGKGAITAIKGTLGIASPSKVMMEMGMHTTAGFAEGVDAGAPKARGAVSDMTAPPSAGKSGGSSNQIAVTFNVSGVNGAEDLRDQLPGLLASAFEQMSLSVGA